MDLYRQMYLILQSVTLDFKNAGLFMAQNYRQAYLC
jgi:hypothetical protein